MAEEETLKIVKKIQCGGCQKYFFSTPLFDKHRTGPSERRRCLTTDEMQAAGMDREYRPVHTIRENKRTREMHDVWYDPDAREKIRSVFADRSMPSKADESLLA